VEHQKTCSAGCRVRCTGRELNQLGWKPGKEGTEGGYIRGFILWKAVTEGSYIRGAFRDERSANGFACGPSNMHKQLIEAMWFSNKSGWKRRAIGWEPN
jgi:hypothetical protein